MAKRFVWRLETVLRHRLRTEEQRQQDLAESLVQLSNEHATRTDLVALQDRCREDLKQRQSGKLNPVDLMQINTYLGDLDRKHQETDQRIAIGQKVVVDKREILAQAVRERQVLENLKEQDYSAFRKKEQRRDQAAMDELASRRSQQIRGDER